MNDRSRAQRFAVTLSPDSLTRFDCKRAAWYETPEEIRAGLSWGQRKAALLRWVRREMGRRLTVRERRCLELYYFHGLTYEVVGKITGSNSSSAFRAVRRSIRKLRARAQSQGITLKRKRYRMSTN